MMADDVVTKLRRLLENVKEDETSPQRLRSLDNAMVAAYHALPALLDVVEAARGLEPRPCPCCEEVWECIEDCDFHYDAPTDAEEMEWERRRFESLRAALTRLEEGRTE